MILKHLNFWWGYFYMPYENMWYAAYDYPFVLFLWCWNINDVWSEPVFLMRIGMYLASPASFFFRPFPRHRALAPALSSSKSSWRWMASSTAAHMVAGAHASPWHDSFWDYGVNVIIADQRKIWNPTKMHLANIALDLGIALLKFTRVICKLGASCHRLPIAVQDCDMLWHDGILSMIHK